MGRRIALTEERRAAMKADIDRMPAHATYRRYDGKWMMRKAQRVGGGLSWFAHLVADLTIPVVVLFVLAWQLPEVVEAAQAHKSQLERESTLTFHVSGNTETGVKHMRTYLQARGFSLAAKQEEADRILVVRKQVVMPHHCRDATALRLAIAVTMPNGLTLQEYQSYLRHRLLSCGPDDYMKDLGRFIDDVLADQEFYLDKYFEAY